MFVERNEEGVIIAVYAWPQPGRAEELLDANDAQISDFYERLKASATSE